MSAEVLRRAAALMRERAEAATPGPWAWEATSQNDNGWCLGVVWDAEDKPLAGRVESDAGEVIDFIAESPFASQSRDADHIASWHPAVALAVADWLDAEADEQERLGSPGSPNITPAGSVAYSVARAYLQETP